MASTRTLFAAATLALAASAASASPQIPTWANPNPDEPVATDGSPLPRQVWSGDALFTGRSVGFRHHTHR